jgi:hypothetical protein
VLFEERGAIEKLQRSWPSALALAIAVGLIYFVAARLGLSLRTDSGVAAFWPAAGIAIAILIVLA